jgi:DNA-binding PadR family transcriptional regulator
MLERLEERGLLTSDMDRSDGRGRRLLRITELGQKALGLWIQQGTDPQTVAAISDHVRTRVFFMNSLPPEERRDFLAAMAEALQGYLRVTEEWLDQTDRDHDPFAWFASQNAVFQARARVEWLAGFQGAMEELESKDQSSSG